ncbi:MAG TPA: DUF4139 domain-containing protein [Rhodanobacteraceae bacterium]
MPRRLLCLAIAALITAPAAFASNATTLTLYHANDNALFSGGTQGTLDAGHALVEESRTVELAPGTHTVRIDDLPATLDPEAIAVNFGGGAKVTVRGQRVVLANASPGGALDGAIGQPVTVATQNGTVSGTLLGASPNGVLIRSADGQTTLIHQYTQLSLPSNAVASGSSLILNVDSAAAGARSTKVTYTASGLGWRAAYRALLEGGAACRMQFTPEASIANRSGRDYANARIKLVAGQANLGTPNVRMFSMAKGPAPMAAAAMPIQAPLGDYRSFTLPGNVSLPNGTVTLAPLYAAQTLACQRQYVVDDGNAYSPPRPNLNDYGANDYHDRAIGSTLSFTAPDALPAGTLRAWLTDRDGAPALLGEGAVADTPKGQQVAVQLGESFDLRASRERTEFHVDARNHNMTEAYRITLSNGGDSARTVTLREHPNRWREWKLTQSSRKPTRQTPQLLEFNVSVPAHGTATLTYAVEYTWTAQEQ